jgi:hypothetical protein
MADAYARARELCQRLQRRQQRVPVLFGQGAYEWVRGELDLALEHAGAMRRLAEAENDSRELVTSCRMDRRRPRVKGITLGGSQTAAGSYADFCNQMLAGRFSGRPLRQRCYVCCAEYVTIRGEPRRTGQSNLLSEFFRAGDALGKHQHGECDPRASHGCDRPATASRNRADKEHCLVPALRAQGLGLRPMSGSGGAVVEASFFPDGRGRSNFILSIGCGERASIRPCSKRPGFAEATAGVQRRRSRQRWPRSGSG